MKLTEKHILHENAPFWVLERPDGKGYDVMQDGVTHATRRAIFGTKDNIYKAKAIKHCDRLAAEHHKNEH